MNIGGNGNQTIIDYRNMMCDLEFMPNYPTPMNSGTEYGCVRNIRPTEGD